jgi:DNA adenine methylase
MKMASVVLSSYAVSHADDPISAPESVGLLARSSGTSNATIDYSHMEIASEPNGQQHDLLSLRDDDAADMHSQSEQPIADQGVVTDAALMDAASNARYSAGSPRANGSTRMLYCYFKQLHPLRCLIHQSRWYLRLSDLKRCQQWSVNRLSIAISSLPLCTMIRASIPQVSSNNHIYSGGLFVNEQGLELLLREHPEWFEIREFNALLRHHVLRVLKDIDWQSTVRSGQGDSVCNWHEQKMDTDLIRVSYLEDSEETNVVEHSHEVQGMDETISEEKDMRNGGDQKPYTLRVRKRRLAHSVARSFVESPSKDLTSSAANRDSDNQEILSCAESAKRRRTRQLGAIRNCVTRRIPTCRQRIYQQQRSSVASVFRSTRSNRFRKNADPSIRFNGSRATVRKRASSPYGRRGRPASGRAASASSGSRRILMARVPLRRAASLTSSAASPEDTCGRRNLSVLQYPGGKTRAIPILMKFLPSAIYNQQQRFVMCSPFIGGASFELQCLEQFPNCFIYAYDKFEPLINFWQCLQMHRTALIKKIEALHPMTAAKFDVLRQRVTRLGAGNLARAAAFYALNRTSFNGMSCSSGFSRSNGKRFNRNPMIERLRGINLDRIVFAVADFEHAIAKHPSQFLFLDPPYALEPGDCHLYGEDGELHREFDHERLHRVLVACIQLHSSPLLLCYNSCKLIQELYGAPTEPAALVAASSRTRRVLRAGSPASRPQHPSSSQHRRDNSNVNFHLHRVSWKYGMSFGKAGRELAITNYPPALRST